VEAEYERLPGISGFVFGSGVLLRSVVRIRGYYGEKLSKQTRCTYALVCGNWLAGYLVYLVGGRTIKD